MLEHWLIELVGHVSGLSDAQLKQVEKSLPATKGLIDILTVDGWTTSDMRSVGARPGVR
jgi:hypothetical protein